uniref:Macaca fascicularis brain cDNA clone: QflA-20286, similar to human rabphilin 3A homolog (mouse) (RPH3A), mRNA, RefSeq: NM_014954.2 n=1 Tax=Macaca fascicularis TaxID=9541 RepID=I7GNB6_MACFA|nr:unnamed protein product [Macaca fascicularis]
MAWLIPTLSCTSCREPASPTSFVQKLCGIPGTPSGMRPSSITASPMRTCKGRPSGSLSVMRTNLATMNLLVRPDSPSRN